MIDFAFLWSYLPFLAEGALLTLEISISAIVLGLVWGFAVALAKMSPFLALRQGANLYISFFRGTPLLIQLFLVYYGLPQLGIDLGPFLSGVLGLGLNVAAYNAEVIRAGIVSISAGQVEAARSLGMGSSLAMRRIVLPQAIPVIIPSLGNNFIALVKDSALVSTITLVELTLTAQRVISTTYRPFDMYFGAAIFYWAMTLSLSFLFAKAERYTLSRR